MYGFRSLREQLLEERRKNAEIEAALAKATADLEYVAMMSDIEIEDEMEGDDNE